MYETVMESDGVDVTMLKGVGDFEDVRWLQQCHLFPGKADLETGDDRCQGRQCQTCLMHINNL
jgi:hypothetical protein